MSMRAQKLRANTARCPIPRVLPLERGDHLSVSEFRRRYDATPDLEIAELINGIVFTASPTDEHRNAEGMLSKWVGVFQAYTSGTDSAHNGTVRLDDKNELRPDLFLRILPEHGGRTATANGYILGGPEVTTEVSATSASLEFHDKLEVFWRHGVQEYVVWRVYDAAIDWFVRGAQGFKRLAPEHGVYKSRVFPGLWLDAGAMLAGNMAQVLTVLQQGLATPEHAAFCQELQRRRDAMSAP